MTSQPLVTIVTPSFNQGRFIRDAIESVLGQSYPRIEHIVVDAGSSDETPRVLDDYRDRLTAIVEPDRGQSDAINKGFSRARGEIVSWLNCDDFLLPGAVQAVVDAFAAADDLGMVYGDGVLVDADGRAPRPFPRPGLMNVWKLVHVSFFLLQPAMFFRRDVLAEIGGLDESLHWGMDWDLAIRIAERFRTAYVPVPLAAQREYADTKTATGGHRRFRELVRIMRRHGDLRYPPAYVKYGLDTYERLLARGVERFTAGLAPVLRTRSRNAVHALAAWVQLRTWSEAEGWYWDRWVTPRARFRLHRDGRALALTGALPADFPLLGGQAIEAWVDGEVALQHPLEFGKFRVLIPVRVGPPFVDVELRASKHFVPRRLGLNADRRTLCYLLDGIEWVR